MTIPLNHRRPEIRVPACLALFGIAGLCLPAIAQQDAPTKSIRWSSGVTETVRSMSSIQTQAELTRLANRAERSHIVVHFSKAITAADRDRLAAAGLTLQSPLGGNSYFATIQNTADTADITRQGMLTSVTEITEKHKLHTDLASGIVRPWMIAQNAAAGNADLQTMIDSGIVTSREFQAADVDPLIAVLVMFHKDADYKAESVRLANELGAAITSEIYSINTVTLHVPLSKIDSIAADDSVQWIEPPLPAMEDLNAENRAAIGADTLNSAPYELDGSGVRVMVYDGGQVHPHADFGSRLTIGASDTDGGSNHATHVAGTIGGDGSIEYNNRGMAPGVEIISYGFEVEGGLSAGFLYTDPGDIEADYSESLSLYNFDIANNSIGTNVEPNGYPCEWTGNYGITSVLLDSIVRGSLGDPVRIVWANGNERTGTRCLGDDSGNHGEFFSTAPPATAKNHITVGAVNSDTDLMTYFSSWGPTDDGRMKPDISAPGCESESGVGVLSTTATVGYGTACGTSMAAPTVTGVCALLLEQYHISFPGQDLPRNATLKTILANTAIDRGNVGPDYAYGFGSVRAQAAVDAIIAGRFLEGAVNQNGVYRFMIEAAPGQDELKVTIAWDDIPGAPNVGNALVNNLDLRIIDPNGVVFLPWTLNPADPGAPAVRTQSDTLNNIEQVLIDDPIPGVYSVEIVGTLIADGAQQSFGATANAAITDCSSRGTITMDRSIVNCDAGAVAIRVADCDLNTDNGIIESIDVIVVSDSQTSGTVITLTETSSDSSVFKGEFAYNSIGGSDLLISNEDTIIAVYSDTNFGPDGPKLLTAAVVVDCTPPMVLSQQNDIWYNYAVIHIESDERVSARVLSGLAGESMSVITQSHSATNTSHSIRIDGLTELTDYIYSVELTDMVGNITLYDNNSAGFSFRTIEGPRSIYEFLVDDTDPAWDMTGDWEFGPASGLAGNPANAFSGTNVIGYDLDDTPPWHLPREYLTTDPMDFTGIYEVRLEFQRWLGMVPDAFAEASIEARIGNGDWQIVWEFSGGRMSPDEWEFVSYDLFDIADNQSAVQFRWVMGELDIHITECGWNIDDIRFTGVTPPPPCPADFTDDGLLDIFDVIEFIAAFNAEDPGADFTSDGVFDIFDVIDYISAFNAGCP